VDQRVAPRRVRREQPAKVADAQPSEPAVAVETVGAEERLDEARKVVARDAAKAKALAEGVLEEKPAPLLEIGALLVLADAHRRTGAWNEAASAYQRVAEHPHGQPYLEEALLRRAQILSSRGAISLFKRLPGRARAPLSSSQRGRSR
jgi:hypothetical protein